MSSLTGSRSPYIVSRIVWGLLITVYVVIGIREIAIGSQGSFVSVGPATSTDFYLRTLLNVREPSRTCTGLIERLDARKPLIFLSPPRDDESDFVYYTLAYLTWPRQIRRVTVEPASLTDVLAAIDRARAGLILSKFRDLPDLPGSQRVGPNLLIVPPTTSE